MAEELGLGGLFEGLAEGQKTAQQKQLFQLSMAEGQLKLGEEAYKFNQLKLITDAQKTAFDKVQMDMLKLDPKTAADPVAKAAAYAADYSSRLFDAGQPVQALHMANTAMGITANQLKIANESYVAARTRTKNVADLMDNLPSNPVEAQRMFDERAMVMQAGGTNIDPNYIAKAREDIANPERRKAWIDTARNHEEAARLQLIKAQGLVQEQQVKHDTALTRKANADAANAERKTTADGKNGVTNAQALKTIVDRLSEEYIAEPGKLRTAGLSAAADYQRAVARGEDKDTALENAINNHREDFAGITMTRQRAGATLDKPIVLDSSEAIDPSKMIPNKYYRAYVQSGPDKGKEVVGWFNPKTGRLEPPPPRKGIPTADQRIMDNEGLPPGITRDPEGDLVDTNGDKVGIEGDQAYLLDEDGELTNVKARE